MTHTQTHTHTYYFIYIDDVSTLIWVKSSSFLVTCATYGSKNLTDRSIFAKVMLIF